MNSAYESTKVNAASEKNSTKEIETTLQRKETASGMLPRIYYFNGII